MALFAHARLKPLGWIGSSKRDLLAFPADVARELGHALYLAQKEQKHAAAKPLKGFGGSGVLEIVEDYAGNAYRAVYTVRFEHVIYVLHVFQKKSKSGIATPRADIERVKLRLTAAEQEYQRWLADNG
ncbi:MAG: type II toxin-antitoxin system RelE/ParE family toxin [Rhodospirillaceae bacterium]|nr:type II toxin-antitoxin system RelE/ParE family toxin [Rhodospirillaceae bacterium]